MSVALGHRVRPCPDYRDDTNMVIDVDLYPSPPQPQPDPQPMVQANAAGCSLLPSALPQPRSSSTSPIKGSTTSGSGSASASRHQHTVDGGRQEHHIVVDEEEAEEEEDDDAAMDEDEDEDEEDEEQFINESPPHVGRALAGASNGNAAAKETRLDEQEDVVHDDEDDDDDDDDDESFFGRDELDVISPARPDSFAFVAAANAAASAAFAAAKANRKPPSGGEMLSPGKRDRKRTVPSAAPGAGELLQRRLNTTTAAAASGSSGSDQVNRPSIPTVDALAARTKSIVTSGSTTDLCTNATTPQHITPSTSTSAVTQSERKSKMIATSSKLPMGGWKVPTPRKQGDLFFDLGPAPSASTNAGASSTRPRASMSVVGVQSTNTSAASITAATARAKMAKQSEEMSIFGIAPGVAARAASEIVVVGSRDKTVIQEAAATLPAGNRDTTATDKKRKQADRDADGQGSTAAAAAAAVATATTAVPPASQVKRRKASGKDVADYRAKYLKAFPNFVFHFDLEADASVVRSLRESVKKLGGRVEEFLSKKVTHVISHKAPGQNGSANSGDSKPSVTATTTVLTPKDVNNSSRMKNTAIGRSADLFKKPELPVKQDVVAASVISAVTQDELLSETVRTALSLKIKVWSTSKLRDVLDILLAGSAASVKAPSRLNDLTFLLEDEKINGTRERDTTAPRADYYYFAQDSVHLLIEDAAGEHRPIMAKQYERQRGSNVEQPWPVLHRSFLRLTESARTHPIPPSEQRERIWQMYVEREGWNGEYAPDEDEDMPWLQASREPGTLDLCDAKIAAGDVDKPYQAASGNSVVLTSNIASTTSNARSGGIGGAGTPNGMGFGGILGASRDKRLVQMSKRVQLLKAKADPAVLAAERKKQALLDTVANDCPAEAESDEELEADSSEEQVEAAALADQAPVMAQAAVFQEPHIPRMTAHDDKGNLYGEIYDELRAKCMRVLYNAKAPLSVPPEYRRALRKMRAGAVVAGATAREAKGGYCENCRIKYDDFEVHINGKRHRRFARDDKNFEKLDELLERLKRPMASKPESIGMREMEV